MSSAATAKSDWPAYSTRSSAKIGSSREDRTRVVLAGNVGGRQHADDARRRSHRRDDRAPRSAHARGSLMRDVDVQRPGQFREVVDIERLAGDVPRGAVMGDRLADAARDAASWLRLPRVDRAGNRPGFASVLDAGLVHRRFPERACGAATSASTARRSGGAGSAPPSADRPADARMSVIGEKSSASAAQRVVDGRLVEGPARQRGFGLQRALRRRRHAAEGNPRAVDQRPSSKRSRNAPITAEISWSKRFEIL